MDDQARMATPDGGIHIGQIFTNVARPRHLWRVAGARGARFILVRVDKPNVLRFPDAKALADDTRYVRAGPERESDGLDAAEPGTRSTRAVISRASEG